MKYVLLLALLALVFFLIGFKRARPREPAVRNKPPAPEAQSSPKAMLRCAECGMHLPADESLPGKGGVFCSAAHRSSFEARRDAA